MVVSSSCSISAAADCGEVGIVVGAALVGAALVGAAEGVKVSKLVGVRDGDALVGAAVGGDIGITVRACDGAAEGGKLGEDEGDKVLED